MILDSSAVVALFIKEPGYEELIQRLTEAKTIGIGAPTLVESAIELSARMKRDARGQLAPFIQERHVTVIPFTEARYSAAVTAWMKYGKGRHPAALNFGDCMAYAMAKTARMPLLCVGNDFRQTDVESY